MSIFNQLQRNKGTISSALGFGSLFLCYSLYESRFVQRFLSIWGGIGYILLLLSAVLDMRG